jgi:hypothetical protein
MFSCLQTGAPASRGPHPDMLPIPLQMQTALHLLLLHESPLILFFVRPTAIQLEK